MGMVQNNGMAHMAGGQMSAYQTPYSSSPYGGNIPTSTAPNIPPNFMPPSSGAQGFPMNSMSVNPQNQAQRMQPPPPSSTPTQPGPRASPFAGPSSHHTPPNAGPQSQFSPPQAANQLHPQNSNNSQQAQAGTILTPQTPNFPPGSQSVNGGSSHVTPLSPGSESREKERVTILLNINQQLLMEVISQQASHAEVKKDDLTSVSSPDVAEKSDQERADEKAGGEKGRPTTREYYECMRRLQSNLAYLAAIADRSHKPSSQIPPHPAILVAPVLNSKSIAGASGASADYEADNEEKDEQAKGNDTRGEILKELYKQLQAVFPGVELKKEAPIQAANPALRAQAHPHGAVHFKQQGQAPDPISQQRMQNEMMRQKMMHHQAQQNAQQQMGLSQQQQQGRVPSR
ncbi:putative endo-1,3(4)-beta-glucanase [Diplocarpon rosae]|nr:putative endo-1,3(4)-beta-glucanase [Diplocarpon rosae]